jgi:uncharacterized tellurite resistance protein B-like protein
MQDRIVTICDLLLGAAYADDVFHDKEAETLTTLLSKLIEGELPAGLKARIEHFDPEGFDLEEAARSFADDSEEDKVKLLELIAAIHAADDEFDFAEDEYLRKVGAALGLSDETLARFTLDIEVEELRDDFGRLSAPPPIPGDAVPE